jgi:predicted ATP-grasp superfamily ATP-dependent carboligase
VCPAQLGDALTERAQTLALEVFRLLGCRGFARVDLMLEEDTDELYVLETNAIPGLTETSLLPLAADAAGIDAVHELTNERYRLERVSRTFHARDVFAPAAAHLAAGVAIEELGPELDPATIVRLDIPQPSVGERHIRASVLVVDRFGNIQLNVRRAHVDAVGLEPGDRVELHYLLGVVTHITKS